MARVEQAGYPYVKGSHGIPFDTLMPGQIRSVESGSGRILDCGVNPGDIFAHDTRNKKLRLYATLAMDGTLNLNLQSRTVEGSKIILHPDLFAARFVGFALRNFELSGETVTGLMGLWFPDSVNYDAFHDALATTGDTVLAAQTTWTGRIAAQYGFTKIERGNVLVVDAKENSSVTAYFGKPDVAARPLSSPPIQYDFSFAEQQ
jgi:hypothetical protein